jgi:hypothetical protein
MLGVYSMVSMACFAAVGCVSGEGADATSGGAASSSRQEPWLAAPAATNLSEHTAPAALAELTRADGGYDMDRLPVVRDQRGDLVVVAQPGKLDAPDGPSANLNASNRSMLVIGGIDLVTYFCADLTLPSALTDSDGGTIRLILQHEVDGGDQVRVIDEHIGTEFSSDAFGDRGRFPGRSGWTRQLGGGEWNWILGDGTAHTLAAAWDWAWITDYRFLGDNTVLGGDTIRICSHPHVTTRVIFLD